MIHLKYWGGLIETIGKRQEEIQAQNIAEVIDHIRKNYGKEAAKEAKRMLIVVNGTNIQLLHRYKTKLSEGETVTFMPLSAGG